MKFLGTKVNGKLLLPPAIAEEKRKFWERIPENSIVESSLTIKKDSKTNKQLATIWGLVLAQAVIELDDRGYDTSFIYNLPKPTGIPISKDDLCSFFYNACPIYNDDGQKITLSKTDVEQAAKFFENVCSWMSTQWQVYIPEPNKNWRNENE